jgi:hypothetical protein
MTVEIAIGKLISVDNGESIDIVSETLDNAPSFPGAEFSDHTNKIGGAYVRELVKWLPEAWRKAYGYGGGEFPCTLYTVNWFINAVKSYRAAYPSATPEFGESIQNAVLARLEVLAWWAWHAQKVHGIEAYVLIS